MSRRIYKYDLPLTAEPCVLMPNGAHILHIGEQNGELKVWALVDTMAERGERWFRIFGTGHDVPDRLDRDHYHHSTVVMSNGLVWHVWCRG